MLLKAFLLSFVGPKLQHLGAVIIPNQNSFEWDNISDNGQYFINGFIDP